LSFIKTITVKIHEKNGFTKISNNLARYRSENNLLDHLNNYVTCLNVDNKAVENDNILANPT